MRAPVAVNDWVTPSVSYIALTVTVYGQCTPKLRPDVFVTTEMRCVVPWANADSPLVHLPVPRVAPLLSVTVALRVSAFPFVESSVTSAPIVVNPSEMLVWYTRYG